MNPQKRYLDLHSENLEPRIMLSTVQLIAGGTEGGEEMQLLIDGNEVQAWTVSDGGDTEQFNIYTWNTSDTITADQVRVQFSNDLYDPSNNVDRNLVVDAIVIDGVRFETEDPGVFSTGTWLPADGIQPGFRESEYLHANGYFQYSSGSGNGSVIQVRALGSEGTEQFRLVIDGTTVQTFDTTSNYQIFNYNAGSPVEIGDVRIEFFGDVYEPANGIDTNLFVDYVAIDGTVYQTEAPTTFSTGTWLPEDGLQPGFRESEELTNNGYFQFDAGTGSGSVIEVRARGSEGTEQFSLLIDGNAVDTFSATTTDQTFSYTAQGVITADRVRVQFLNDVWEPENGIDANLIVDFITIDGTVYQTEDPRVFSTGTWVAGDGISPGFGRGDTLHAIGYFQYSTTVDNEPFDLNGQPVFQRNGHLYLLTSASTSWTAAQTEATSVGGNLVAINDAAEEAWLQQIFGTSSNLWIGLTDQASEGTFTWINGEAVTYTNWDSGEPNDGGGSGQDYGVMNFNSRWDDQVDNADHFGVIEIGGGTAIQQNGLLAEYYDSLDFGNLFATRVDSTVDFDWGNGAPISGMGANTFSVRWTGQIQPEFTGTYTFRTTSDDGVRLYVDNQLIINEWNDHAATQHTGTISLLAGQRYDLRMEFYERNGNAVSRLEWAAPGQSFELIPVDRLFAASSPSANPNGTGFTTELIAQGLNQPVAFAVAPDGRIFVTEKEGRVKVIQNGQIVSTFLDINEEVQSGHDRGLMGIALDPDFETNGHVYLNFSEEINPDNPDDASSGSDAAGRLIRISASTSNPDVADLSTRVEVLTGHQMTHFTHAVGDVDFDNQGNLIFTWGDGGFDPVLRLEAQDPNSKQGKLFRLNRFTFEGVPDNPFYNASNPDSTASKVWALGVRNSWKLTVDRVTGDVWMGEVTDGGPEEINVMRADGSTVLNFGWPYYEDNIRTSYGDVPSNFTYERAFIGLPHTNAGGGDSILGGAVFRGDAYSDVYDGRYFFGNFNQGILYTADTQTGTYQQFGTAGDYAGVVDLQLGPDGHIWMMNLFTGRIERLIDNNAGSDNSNPLADARATRTAGTGPLTVTFDALRSSDPDGDTLDYAWDFDSDGVIDAGGAIASHTYSNIGRSTATLIVFDSEGGADSTLVEVNVLASPDNNNLAIGRPTEQSLTDGLFISSRAVDGNTSGADSFSQTVRQRTPLLEIDLESVQFITDIEIYIPAGAELSDFWVLVSDNPFSSGNLDAARNDPGVLAYQIPGSVSNGLMSIDVDANGRYVRVQRAGENEVLTLSEVRVLG